MRPRHRNPRPSALGPWTLDFGLWTSFLAVSLLLAVVPSLPAQRFAAPQQDPLMSLMMVQPKLEIPAVTTATATFDPPMVRPGEQAFLRIVFNALEESIEWPTNLAGPAQLEMRSGAHGQNLQMAGTGMEPRTAFNYRVRASSPGLFTVPEFVVKVNGKPVRVPTAQLQVVSAPAASLPTAPQLTLALPVTNLFVGQAVPVRVVLPGSPAGVVQGLGLAQLSGRGFLVDVAAARQRIEMMPRGGVNVIAFIYETTLTPVMTGKLTVVAQGFTAGNRFSGPIVINGTASIPGGPPQYTLLESEPVELNVRPLPREGELPGFNGAIGSFSVGPPTIAADVLRVGDPVKLTVLISNQGDSPLTRLVAPAAPQVPDWQVFAVADSNPVQPIPPPGIGALVQSGVPPGALTFNYTLIPLTETARATPPIPFSCFDPKVGAYVDLTIPSVPVTVKPGTAPGDLASLLQAGSAGVETEKELVLSGLAASRGQTAYSLVPPQQQAWFPLVQLAPAALFFGLWSWDRRRRYLETHPDVLLRRRARRALHRQQRVLHRAARAADAPRYAAAAVSAMRVACAPHYPAEPRALVGCDVLPLLSETERAGRAGEVVRRFFDVTDAARFGTAMQGRGSLKSEVRSPKEIRTPKSEIRSPMGDGQGENADELLSLQADLDRVLQQLEQKL